MRSILFFIPAELAGVPVFGFGWLLGAWILFGVLWMVRAAWRGGSREAASYVPILLIVAVAIAWLLPGMVVHSSAGEAIGVPIRGFGVMLMVATVAGVGLAGYRAWQVGIEPDAIYSLAFVMFIAGIIGARLFYVLEYWNQFVHYSPGGGLDLGATAVALVNVTQGGLVVYGSVLAGIPAGIWYCRRRGLPVLPVGDIIAPGMALGLALGRIGCFLNGCCYGGVCLTAAYAVTFPAGSPPYEQQQQAGWHSGVWLEEQNGEVIVAYLAPQSDLVRQGLKEGDKVVSINGVSVESLSEARDRLARGSAFEVETADGRVVRFSGPQPPRSVPVHPAQLYAAIDAAILSLLLWFYFPFRRRDGEVFALLITLHPISRFLLEMIRSDEPGRFGTELTISQWLSLGMLAAAGVLWWYVEKGFKVRGSGFSGGVSETNWQTVDRP